MIARSIDAEPGALGSASARLAEAERIIERVAAGDASDPLFVATPVAAYRAYWSSLLDLVLVAARESPEVLASPVLRQSLAQQLVAASQLAFPTDWLARRRSSWSEPVRRAVAFVQSNAGMPLTLDEIAAAAGASPRVLQNAFRREVDSTPLEYSRLVRLRGAYLELLAAEPGRALVRDVARRWGFSHLGRFSVAYRATFGESPSETLGR